MTVAVIAVAFLTVTAAVAGYLYGFVAGYARGRWVEPPRPPAPRPSDPQVRLLPPMYVYDWETDG